MSINPHRKKDPVSGRSRASRGQPPGSRGTLLGLDRLGFFPMLQRCSCAIVLAVMLVGLPTAQAAEFKVEANGSRRMQSGRSERQHRPASQLPHECRSAGRTMDAADTAAPETWYCGRSQALLYNATRPHQALGHRSPMTVWREGIFPNTAVDMTLHLDNAVALPTWPQPQQQQQLCAA